MDVNVNFDVQMPVTGLVANIERRLKDWVVQPIHESALDGTPDELLSAARRMARARIAELNSMPASKRSRMFPGVGHAIFNDVELA